MNGQTAAESATAAKTKRFLHFPAKTSPHTAEMSAHPALRAVTPTACGNTCCGGSAVECSSSSSSDAEDELNAMLGLSAEDFVGVSAEDHVVSGVKGTATEGKAPCSRLGGPVLICDEAHESAAAFAAFRCGSSGAGGKPPPPPWKLDVVDRPELVEALMRRCFDGVVARAGASPVTWDATHFARVRLCDYVRGGNWEWHQDKVVETVVGGNRTHKTALLYLTSPRRGGETEFLVRPGSVPVEGHSGVSVMPMTVGREIYDKITVRPLRGRVVVFDHNVRHRANPVIDSKLIAQVKVCDPTLAQQGASAPPMYSF